MDDKLKELLKSRKFWAALLAVAFVLLKTYAPNLALDEQAITELVYVIVAYILGTAIEAHGKAK